jgi:hypothetical protein
MLLDAFGRDTRVYAAPEDNISLTKDEVALFREIVIISSPIIGMSSKAD